MSRHGERSPRAVLASYVVGILVIIIGRFIAAQLAPEWWFVVGAATGIAMAAVMDVAQAWMGDRR